MAAESQYSQKAGLIFVFNLIVGTGALTMPGAFHSAGWLLSLVIILMLGFMSYLTGTFVMESMAAANAEHESVGLPVKSGLAEEKQPLLSDEQHGCYIAIDNNGSTGVNIGTLFQIKVRQEMGHMASMFFSKAGVVLFYACICVYLYGDMAIYAAAVPKSLRLVICTYQLANGTACNITLTEDDQCWPGVTSISRMNAYRMAVALFAVCLGPFIFFNVQKTLYIQVVTAITRWLAFVLMIILACIRLTNGQGQGHPILADLSGVPNLFGVCVYSFMCHHSLPSLITPIRKKANIHRLLGGDYLLISIFYLILAITAVYAFDSLKDLYTLNFFPERCDTSSSAITNIKFFQYFIVLFPVFALSSNFPIIGISLRNNLKTLFHKDTSDATWVRIVFPLATIIPPLAVAFATNEVNFLVGVTGSYAGAAIQYIIPAMLVYCSRKKMITRFGGDVRNIHTSPFKHIAWVVFVCVWAVVCIGFVTINYIINRS